MDGHFWGTFGAHLGHFRGTLGALLGHIWGTLGAPRRTANSCGQNSKTNNYEVRFKNEAKRFNRMEADSDLKSAKPSPRFSSRRLNFLVASLTSSFQSSLAASMSKLSSSHSSLSRSSSGIVVTSPSTARLTTGASAQQGGNLSHGSGLAAHASALASTVSSPPAALTIWKYCPWCGKQFADEKEEHCGGCDRLRGKSEARARSISATPPRIFARAPYFRLAWDHCLFVIST